MSKFFTRVLATSSAVILVGTLAVPGVANAAETSSRNLPNGCKLTGVQSYFTTGRLASVVGIQASTKEQTNGNCAYLEVAVRFRNSNGVFVTAKVTGFVSTVSTQKFATNVVDYTDHNGKGTTEPGLTTSELWGFRFDGKQ